jgi:hypothetical protein
MPMVLTPPVTVPMPTVLTPPVTRVTVAGGGRLRLPSVIMASGVMMWIERDRAKRMDGGRIDG